MAAHQAPSSLGFSRQEHWSGLPFPSPMHESEKWKWSLSVVSNSSRPPGLQPTRLLRPWDFPGKSAGVGCHCLFQRIHWWKSMRSLITMHLSRENPPVQEMRVPSLGQKDLQRRKWQPTPVLPGKSRGQRSLADYSPCGRKESDTTRSLSTAHDIKSKWHFS